MESYIELTVDVSDEFMNDLSRIVAILNSGDNSGLGAVLDELGKRACDQPTEFGALSSNDITAIELKSENQNRLSIAATCGLDGFDFLIDLIRVFGPASNALSASFHHDEEPEDGEWPMKLSYADGAILVNGEVHEPRSRSSTVDLVGKYVSLAVIAGDEPNEEGEDRYEYWSFEMDLSGVHPQRQIDDKTDYVVYCDPGDDDPDDDERLSDLNNQELLQSAKKRGCKLLSFFDLQDLLAELDELAMDFSTRMRPSSAISFADFELSSLACSRKGRRPWHIRRRTVGYGGWSAIDIQPRASELINQ